MEAELLRLLGKIVMLQYLQVIFSSGILFNLFVVIVLMGRKNW